MLWKKHVLKETPGLNLHSTALHSWDNYGLISVIGKSHVNSIIKLRHTIHFFFKVLLMQSRGVVDDAWSLLATINLIERLSILL